MHRKRNRPLRSLPVANYLTHASIVAIDAAG
jgi:hypothetical protein